MIIYRDYMGEWNCVCVQIIIPFGNGLVLERERERESSNAMGSRK